MTVTVRGVVRVNIPRKSTAMRCLGSVGVGSVFIILGNLIDSPG